VTKLERQIIDVPVEQVPGIEKLFGQMLKMDVNNIPGKYKKAFDRTKGVAFDTFSMKAIFESYEIDEIKDDRLVLRNGITITSKVMSDVFCNSFELVFYVVTLTGYEEADEAEESMFNKLFMDHWGTAFIECADSWFGKTIAKSLEEEGVYATHSFSPGQSDTPLEMQTPIFELLMPADIGVTLNDRYMMHPKKTVSGIMGLKLEKDENRIRPCDICERRETCPNVHHESFEI
jgi:hypothetical protein